MDWYSVSPQLASISAATRLGIDSQRFSKYRGVICLQALRVAFLRSAIEVSQFTSLFLQMQIKIRGVTRPSLKPPHLAIIESYHRSLGTMRQRFVLHELEWLPRANAIQIRGCASIEDDLTQFTKCM